MDSDEEGCFSFIWAIQNYNSCFRERSYKSPIFGLDETRGDQWWLFLIHKRCYRHDKIDLILYKYLDAGNNRDIFFEILICDFKRPYISKSRMNFDSSNYKSDPFTFILNKEVFVTYPDNDSLTIKCRIWLAETGVLKTRQCYARTIINAERIIQSCTLEGLEEFENGASIEKRIIILSGKPFFTMDLSSTGETFEDKKK